MKKFTLLFALSLGFISTSLAQVIVARSYIEHTHVSPKAGTAIGYQSYHGFEVGAFYQESSILESMLGEDRKAALPTRYEQVLYGVYFGYRILDTHQLNVQYNIRTGLANGDSFVFTHSILGNYKLTEVIQVGIGVGSRAFRPTLQSGISILF